MKKIIIIFAFIKSTFAITGVIKALEVPLLKTESESSQILQKKRLGEKIHIHDNSLNNQSQYYMTLTRDGLSAYIRKDFVKIIYNNISELDENISAINDTTDYRTDEPMPEGYPFKSENSMKASLYMNYASATSNSYEYVNNKTREQYSPILSLSIKYLRAPSYDNTDRIYYGFLVGGQTERNEFQVSNNIFTQEDSTKLYFGSSFQYTFYRRRFFEIDIGVDTLLNFHKAYVGQENISNNTFEERLFTGMFVSAKANVFFIHKDSFGKRNLDIIHGPNLTINSPYSLTSSQAPILTDLWPSDSIKIATEVSYGYMLGFTIRY